MNPMCAASESSSPRSYPGVGSTLLCVSVSPSWQSKTAVSAWSTGWSAIIIVHPHEQNLFNGCSGIPCGTTASHEAWPSDTFARFSVAWECLVAGRSKGLFSFELQAKSLISLANIYTTYTPYTHIHNLSNLAKNLKSQPSQFTLKFPLGPCLGNVSTSLGLQDPRKIAWVKFRMSFKAILSRHQENSPKHLRNT